MKTCAMVRDDGTRVLLVTYGDGKLTYMIDNFYASPPHRVAIDKGIAFFRERGYVEHVTQIEDKIWK